MRRADWRNLGLTLLLVAAGVGAVLGGALAPATTQAQPAREVTVFAAASLTDALTELASLYEQRYAGVKVVFNFGASSTLRAQLEHGAPADIFASADLRQMDLAQAAGIVTAEPKVFAQNRLVVIRPKANPAGLASLRDLARPGVRLIVAGPEVPAGVYTKQMLDKLGQEPSYGPDFATRALANVVSEEPNVRQVVAKIWLGEGDIGVVYASDVTAVVAPDLALVDVPTEVNVGADYPIAVVAATRQRDLAEQFVTLVLSPEGQAVFARQNFTPVGLTQ